jgi:ATP-binding cassette, subfamily G (WHITE), member 1
MINFDIPNITKAAIEKSRTVPIKISFKDLEFSVNRQNSWFKTHDDCKSKTIVKKCSGYFLPGQTHYILGPSGSGKTTLLNLLSGYQTKEQGNSLQGSIQVNDSVALTAKTFSAYGAYLTQDDTLFEWFTVEEAILFAASLKLTLSKEEISKRVDETIK